MPGIVGIIRPVREQEGSSLVNAMLATMKHETFYRTETCAIPDMNVHAGFAGFDDSADGICSDENVSLIFSGECFVDSEIATGAKLAQLYRDKGRKFLEELNGLFCGLLIDRQQRKIILFNDRYGIQRVYFHENKDGFYFASEAKALLKILPELREFNPEGVTDFLTFGCTLDWKTLFRGIEILPGGSAWSFENGACRKEKYFSPDAWESQPHLTATEFEDRLQQTFKRILPRYFHSASKTGLALTGGLDTRMILACRPRNNGHTTCYTFTGNNGQTLDDQIAARVAAASHLEHNVLRLGEDFFSNFAAQVDKTVFVTDGCAGVFNAHEIYFNHRARQFAPVRLTGNYGSEILRGVSTFKPVPYDPELFSPDWKARINSRAQSLAAQKKQRMTFAAFKEIPWNLFGNLEAGRSQLRFRTPYLDNDLVSLAFQAPDELRASSLLSCRLVRANDPTLSEIPTDRGFAGDNSGLKFLYRRIMAETTFKLDYYNNEGLPNLLAPFDPIFKGVASRLGIIGLHKFLHYRSWFRKELAGYVSEAFSNLQGRLGGFWNPDFVKNMAGEHLEGRKNYSLEIHAVLTLDAIQRQLLRGN
jgi:asparagine synthase (glutamine-hydrolysing)